MSCPLGTCKQRRPASKKYVSHIGGFKNNYSALDFIKAFRKTITSIHLLDEIDLYNKIHLMSNISAKYNL